MTLSFHDREFERAFELTQKEHPLLQHPKPAQDFLIELHSRYRKNQRVHPESARQTFGEILRETLNDFDIKGKKRKAYKSLAGHFSGLRARKVPRRARGTAPKRVAEIKTQLDKDTGQFSWKI